MPYILALLGLLVGVVVGVIGGFYVLQNIRRNQVDSAERSAASILNEADRRQKELLLEAKEEAIRVRREAESELKERRNELKAGERRLTQKEESLDRKLESVEQRTKNLQRKETDLEEQHSQLESLQEERKHELERLSNLTANEARDQLLAQVENLAGRLDESCNLLWPRIILTILRDLKALGSLQEPTGEF